MRRSFLRRGFTLVELLISMTILAIIGTAATKMLMTQSRFAELVYAKRSARAVGRASINLLLSELQMVQDVGGLDSIATNGKLIRLRVPYRFGMVCADTGTVKITASMLPVDSAVLAQAVYVGFAYRVQATGLYTYVTGSGSPVTAATPATCTGTGTGQQNIQTISLNGRSGANLEVTPGNAAALPRQPIFFWQHITYSFQASTAYPGYNGLFRSVQGGNTDELMAPFDTSSRFRTYKLNDDTSRTTIALADTASIVGFDVVLNGRSSQSLVTYSSPTVKMTTSVFFKNTHTF